MVIVGAGPAGAALTLLLARRGIAVTLVEASTRNDRRFRGEALFPSGLAALERIAGPSLLQGLPHRALAGWRFVLDGEELFRASEPLEPGPPCTLVSQPALLGALLEEAARQPACRVLRGSGAASLLEQNGRIAGVCLGNGQRLPADLVVACDGRRSLLRRRAGLELVEQPGGLELLWFSLSGEGRDSGPGGEAGPPPALPNGDTFTTLVGRAGLVSLCTGANGSPQLAWVPAAPVSSEAPEARWRELWARQAPAELAQWLRSSGVRAAPPLRVSVRAGLAPLWHRSGLLLLGDAAHPMSPVRAQGLNLALRDALVADQELGPLLAEASPPPPERIDAALGRIQALRLEEIRTLQELQRQEARQGLLLQRLPALRAALRLGAPLLAPALRRHWIHRQHLLRQGLPQSCPAG